ncbi:MAG: membrane protein insertase YidC, partial [Methyloceanibacter sp.]
MDENNRNFILAILLSLGVLFAWQVLFLPKTPPSDTKQAAQQEQRVEPGPPQPPPQSGGAPESAAPQAGAAAVALTREEALAKSPRIAIDTPSLKGSIALKGGRIDDLTLKDYRETVEPSSPQVVLLSPAGGPHAYYAESGFVGGEGLALPHADTLWTAASEAPLTQDAPVTLTYDNGKGLKFTRTISVDDKYMFTIDDQVANTGADTVTLHPYALVSRHETPHVQGFYILHEGLIGVVNEGLEEITYASALEEPKPMQFESKNGWLGITDKYWATVVIPEQGKPFDATFSGRRQADGRDIFQTDYLMAPLAIAPGQTGQAQGRVFAGAKEVHVVDGYAATYAIPRFDRLIDWGWFYFLTKPLFFALDFFYKLVGNFGVSILIVTIIIKLILFPLANKS